MMEDKERQFQALATYIARHITEHGKVEKDLDRLYKIVFFLIALNIAAWLTLILCII